MTRTAIYSLQDNALTEQPDLDPPPDKPIENNYWGNVARFSRDMQIWKRVMDDYNANAQLVASACRTIPCHESARSLWKDGQKVEEGKDYEVREDEIDNDGHLLYAEVAFPVKSEQNEDELWKEVHLLINKHPLISREKIAELKSKYSIIKR